MPSRLCFYRDTIEKWITDRQSSILIGAGGKNDQDIFQSLGFKDVLISNINQPLLEKQLNSYRWSQQNLEALSFPDETFDYVVVHAGLHHCQSPHRSLLEMYRVARKAIIAFEPPDNMLVRLMQKAGLAQIYEYTAVQHNDGTSGGVNNTDIPNFIYRWSEKEVEKTINSFAPAAHHHFHYSYASDEPTPEFIGKNRAKYFLINLAKPVYTLWGRCFPKQQNLFAFMVEKPVLSQDIHPWLIEDDGVIKFNPDWKIL